MEYTVKVHPAAAALIRTNRMSEALMMARTTARFMHRSAYIYSPWSHTYYEVRP